MWMELLISGDDSNMSACVCESLQTVCLRLVPFILGSRFFGPPSLCKMTYQSYVGHKSQEPPLKFSHYDEVLLSVGVADSFLSCQKSPINVLKFMFLLLDSMGAEH